jgi:hypothetical protein
MGLLSSSGDFVEVLEEALDARAHNLALLLEGFYLGGGVLTLRGELLDLMFERGDALLGGCAGLTLRLEELDRAQYPLLECAEVIGSEWKFGFLDGSGGRHAGILLKLASSRSISLAGQRKSRKVIAC